MKIDREQWQIVVALVAVAVVATTLLGLVDMFTREPIQAAQREALHRALVQVLPEHANDPQHDVVTIGKDKDAIDIYPAIDGEGKLTGLAWETVAPDGYSGSIRILLGIYPEGRIYAIRVTDHRETPGLGDGIVLNQPWLKSFSNKALAGTVWAVKKDGGEFDQFTGATITPRAVVKEVKRALEFFSARQQVILQAIADRHQQSGGSL